MNDPWSLLAASIACLVCFGLLGFAAFDFLSPNLTFIAKKYQISQVIMGVTVLAFGNGCVDVMSAIASAKADEMGMALGAIIGGCLFVVCVVTGAMGLVDPFEVDYNHFLRDSLACLVSVFIVLVVSWDERISVYESLVLLATYLVYSLVVVYMETKESQNENFVPEIHIDQAPVRPSLFKSVDLSWRLSHDEQLSPLALSPIPSEDGASFVNELIETNFYVPEEPDLHVRDTLSAMFFPFGSDWISKLKFVVVPLMFPVCASVPKPEFEESKVALSIYALGVPLSLNLLLPLDFSLELAGIQLVACLLTLLWIWVVKRKIYESVLVFTGLVISVLWVLFFANLLVELVVRLGEVTGVPKQILGFTVFALGDSIGDLVSNITVARLGFSKMAFSACFGGPVFTLLVGVSLASLAGMAAHRTTEIKFHASYGMLISGVSIITVVLVMIMVLSKKRHFGRWLGGINICIWTLTTASILIFGGK